MPNPSGDKVAARLAAPALPLGMQLYNRLASQAMALRDFFDVDSEPGHWVHGLDEIQAVLTVLKREARKARDGPQEAPNA